MQKESNTSGSKFSRTILLLVLMVGVLLRFLKISELAPFVDESGNILAGIDPAIRTIIDPSTIGRPLLSYLFKPTVILHDWMPFVSVLTFARAFAASASLTAGLLIAAIASHIADKFVGIVVLLLWCTLPTLALHDRLALQDPFTSFFLASVLYLLALYHQRARSLQSKVTIGLLVTISLCLAIFNKITAIAAIPWIVCLDIVFQRYWRKSSYSLLLANVILSSLVIVLLVWGDGLVASRARLALFGYGSNLSQQLLSRQGIESIALTAGTWIRLFWEYDGTPFCVLVVVIGILAVFRTDTLRLAFVAVVAAAMLTSVAFSRHLFGRYLHTDHLPFLLLIPICLRECLTVEASGAIPHKILRVVVPGLKIDRLAIRGLVIRDLVIHGLVIEGLAILSAVINVWNIMLWVTTYSNVVPADYRGYRTSSWSGWGLEKLQQIVSEYAENSNVPVTVFGLGGYGPATLGLRLLNNQNPRLKIIELDVPNPLVALVIDSIAREQGKDSQALFLFENFNVASADEIKRLLLARGTEARLVGSVANSEHRLHAALFAFETANEERLLAQAPVALPDPEGWLAPKVSLPLSAQLVSGHSSAQSLQAVAPQCLWGKSMAAVIDLEGTITRVPLVVSENGAIDLPEQLKSLKSLLLQGPGQLRFTSWCMVPDKFASQALFRNRVTVVSIRFCSGSCEMK